MKDEESWGVERRGNKRCDRQNPGMEGKLAINSVSRQLAKFEPE